MRKILLVFGIILMFISFGCVASEEVSDFDEIVIVSNPEYILKIWEDGEFIRF